MKRISKRFALAAAAMTLIAPIATTAASADPGQYNGGYRHDDNRNDRGDRYDRNDRGDRNYDRGDRGDHNGWNNQYERHSYRRGDRLSAYDQGRFRAFDYRREHYRAPPRGYRYVRDDRGDTLLVGILSGVILGTIISNNQGYDQGYYNNGYGY